MYSFGENKLGQLGQGNQTDAVLTPALVSQSVTRTFPSFIICKCAGVGVTAVQVSSVTGNEYS